MPNLAGFPPQGSGGAGLTGVTEDGGTPNVVTSTDVLVVGTGTTTRGSYVADADGVLVSEDATGNMLVWAGDEGSNAKLQLLRFPATGTIGVELLHDDSGGGTVGLWEWATNTGSLFDLYASDRTKMVAVSGSTAGGTEFMFADDVHLQWFPGAADSGSADVGIERDAAGTLKITNGSTGGGALRVGSTTAGAADGSFAAGTAADYVNFNTNSGAPRLDLFDGGTNTLRLGVNAGNAVLELHSTGGVWFYDSDPNGGSVDVAIERSAANVLAVYKQDGGGNGLSSILSNVLVEANTAGSGAPNAIGNQECGTVFTNEGATAENHHNLPTAAAGLTYTFIVQDGDGMQINAATGDTIRIAASVSASGGDISTSTIGNTVTLCAVNATEWIATAVNGTWTVT